jgi:hypothetical protein
MTSPRTIRDAVSFGARDKLPAGCGGQVNFISRPYLLLARSIALAGSFRRPRRGWSVRSVLSWSALRRQVSTHRVLSRCAMPLVCAQKRLLRHFCAGCSAPESRAIAGVAGCSGAPSLCFASASHRDGALKLRRDHENMPRVCRPSACAMCARWRTSLARWTLARGARSDGVESALTRLCLTRCAHRAHRFSGCRGAPLEGGARVAGV